MSTEDSNNTLPSIATEKGAAAVFACLSKMSKRGKLAGFEYDGGPGAAIADAHGAPFDSDLVIELIDGEVRFSLKMRRKFPVIFAIVLVFTVWPGLPLTDSFMYAFGWYERLMGESIQTWMWYLPMTVFPIPFAWKSAIKKSKASAYTHAGETIEQIRVTLDS